MVAEEFTQANTTKSDVKSNFLPKKHDWNGYPILYSRLNRPGGQKLYVTIPGLETVKSREMRKQNENKGVYKHVVGYVKDTILVAELPAAPTVMAFDQLVGKDADKARKELRNIIAPASRKD